MYTINQFETWLAGRKYAIIDGALATELEHRGHDLNHALWSAKVLTESPESIRSVHLDYFLAGADIAITASYQATPQGLEEHMGLRSDESTKLIQNSVLLAQNAREAAYERGVDRDRPLLVAGSIGPFGAYLADGSEYRGDYVRTKEQFQAFHRPRIQTLVDSGVDLLALETMPNMVEIEALLSLLADEFPTAIAWLSCTSRSPECLCDGTPWAKVFDASLYHSGQMVAVGVNCVPMHSATETLEHIGTCTRMPLLCYPSSGEVWDAEAKIWHNSSSDTVLGGHSEAQVDYTDKEQVLLRMQSSIPVSAWVAAGARLIGGCCRTGPTFIGTLAAGRV